MEHHHAINGSITYFDWAIFNSYLLVYQRVNLHFPMVFLWFSGFLWFFYGFPMVFPLISSPGPPTARITASKVCVVPAVHTWPMARIRDVRLLYIHHCSIYKLTYVCNIIYNICIHIYIICIHIYIIYIYIHVYIIYTYIYNYTYVYIYDN